MSTLREAAQQALEALEHIEHHYISLPKAGNKAITALRAALAQPEQEPVLTINKLGSLVECSPTIAAFALPDGEFTLYTTPPRREWQGLTEEEREQATGWSVEHIEAKLKEKNA